MVDRYINNLLEDEELLDVFKRLGLDYHKAVNFLYLIYGLGYYVDSVFRKK